MSQLPDVPDAPRGEEPAALFQLIARALLPPGGLLDRELDDGSLHLGLEAILEDWFAPADLLEGDFAALVIAWFETREAVAAVAQDLAAWLRLPRVQANRRTPTLFLMIF